jgi:hypothetical protein
MLSFVATTLPSAAVIVAVTVTMALADDWFCTSVATATVADVALTAGVVTKTPLLGTWTELSTLSQTLR